MSKLKKTGMVGWYDVGQLWNTAGKTIISTIIGENADQRLTNASLTTQPVYDYSFHLNATNRDFESNGEARKDFWIDYVSDVGDGWDSTYSVAYNLAKKNLKFDNETTNRGELLIFGGDEVYPTGSQKEYQKRLIEPYRMAFEHSKTEPSTIENPTELTENPHVFAVPGNHDWYDSLIAFRYLFGARYFNNRLFAGHWRTRQRRSYFALKLPFDWWIFGIDLQLTHTMDWAQLEYYRSIIETNGKTNNQGGPVFNAGSKVIICSPEPLWVEKEKYKKVNNETSFDEDKLNLKILEKMIHDNGSEIKLYLAGDSHHYRRFEEMTSNAGKAQKITAGGGGAFLHPTHDIDFDIISENVSQRKFHLEMEYPDKPLSKKLSWRNLWFPVLNPWFGILSGSLYAIVAWLVHGSLHNSYGTKENSTLADVVSNASGLTFWSFLTNALKETINSLIENPLALLVVAILMIGLLFFTDSESKLQKYGGGLLHGFSHLTAIFFIGWGSYLLYLFVDGKHFQFLSKISSDVLWFLIVIPTTFAAGWILGSFIMGWYLLISLLRGRHSNEAFSALKLADYKCFLRLHLTQDALTIYPFKIEKAACQWSAQPNINDIKYYEPLTDIDPQKIESKITISFESK